MKLPETKNKKRTWSEEDKNYLQEKWGAISIPTIAKKLGRSESAVRVMAQRLGCGSHLNNDDCITLNQLMLTIYGGVQMGTYTNNRLIRAGLPIRWHKVCEKRFRVINIDDFWEWAEKNKGILDFSKFEEMSLGAEPEWVKTKRKADYDKLKRNGQHNAPWKKYEDEKLIYLLGKHKYTYQEIAKELKHSEGAVKRRITELGLKERPVRNPQRKWTEEEIEILCTMLSQGYDFGKIAEKIGRTALATRGKYERLQNPEYMKRYYRGEREYSFQSIHGIDPMEVLRLHKAMLHSDFQESPPVKNKYNKGKEKAQLNE